MRLVIPEHPLIQHKLTILRDENTSRSLFRQLVEDLGLLLCVEASRTLRLEPHEIHTPEEVFVGQTLTHPLPVVVPILRAGLGMLGGVERLIPGAEVGFLGMRRDEITHVPTTYASRLSHDLSGRRCLVLDPMIATGGSMNAAIDFLFDRGASEVSVLSIIASPSGVETVRSANAGRNVSLYLAALDRELNEHAYIVPGLGDAGDRLYGAVD